MNKSGVGDAEKPVLKSQEKGAVALIVLGMAGSGKTTVVQRLLAEMETAGNSTFCINLDPAVGGGIAPDGEENEDDWNGLPYDPNVDIRDSINYKEVMGAYGLGPNGAILTCLNLFSTKFDEVANIIERRKGTTDYFIFDTPGQIEAFTWSASGSIITESIASILPTVLVYVVDTPRSNSATTFTSNMLYACSIMFRTKLPMVLLFNKIDVSNHVRLLDWMTDLDAFQEALDAEEGTGDYMSTLTRSMGLVLNEFYETLKAIGFSAVSGQGFRELVDAVNAGSMDYKTSYVPELERRRAEAKLQQTYRA